MKVVPRASRSEVAGWAGDALRVRVAAVPTDGRANDALEEFLARWLGLKRAQVRVVAGHASRRKLLEIDGIDRAELERRCRASGA
ncbi:MAG TPA: DUF167 domain-containing protein [Gammaproteobacteria bacterium]